jgi:DNA excision repair protein ERCC-1
MSGAGSKLFVSPRQQHNPVLKLVKNVAFVLADCAADFHVNQDVGCLYLSMSFHLLNPRYIVGRLDNLPGYKHRIVVLNNDREGCDKEMIELRLAA